jgi:hypothetical protein
MFRLIPTRRFSQFAVLGALLVAGCSGRGVGEVSGKVTYKERPLTTGSITFIAPNIPPIVARIEPDGSYVAKNVPAGDVVITIMSLDPAAVSKVQGKSASDLPPEAPRNSSNQRDRPDNTGWFAIPVKYSHAGSSDLKLSVKPGANDYPVQLTD